MFNRKFATVAAASLAFAAQPALAQDADRMTEVIEVEVDTGKFMGAVLVAKDGTPILDRAWGSADLEWGIANTTTTKFRIGSVTKQFTAVSALLLQEQGKLDLDAPIATYLENAPSAWEGITVRNLVRHTAGVPNVTSLEDFGRQKFLPTSQDELIAMFRDLPLEFEPGSKFSYSNSGYVLLSRIVENVSEQSLADFYQANLFDPLGMADTGLDNSSEILPNRADGYSPSGDGETVINAEYVNMAIPTGAGAMYSTTGDLLKWQQGLFGGQVLSNASLTEYVTPAEFEAFFGDKYAHAVLVDTTEDNTYYWHGGGIEGFNAWLSYDPDRKITVAVLANLNGGAASKLGQQLMTLVQGGDVVLPGEREVAELATEQMAQYEGVYAISPEFKLTVFQNGGKLMTQATGQDAFEIFPEGTDTFFVKVVDAQLQFNRNEGGTIESVTLFQNGREIPAVKE